MVLIKKIHKLEKERNHLHGGVDCTYTVFTDSNGNKIFQLDTYGSANREYKGKVSQSIQFDKISAKKINRINI